MISRKRTAVTIGGGGFFSWGRSEGFLGGRRKKVVAVGDGVFDGSRRKVLAVGEVFSGGRRKKAVAIGEMFLLISLSFAFAFIFGEGVGLVKKITIW